MKLLVFGSANIDHVYRLPHQVRSGETLASTQYARNAGGKGFNQAVALAKAGQEVLFGGAIGQDGLFLKELLTEYGVDASPLMVKDVPTGHAIIQVDDEGRNAIVLYGGANQAITEGDIDRMLDLLAPGDYLLLQNEISHGDYILSAAAKRDLQVVLNPSPFDPAMLSWPLENVAWFLLNEVEGRDMTGYTEADDILDELQAKYPEAHIVLTLGAEGAAYAFADTRMYKPAVRTAAVDTTAAGDTFTGYFLQGMLAGKPIAQALERAAQAAAITVSRAGAAQSIPTADEVAARFGWEG